jgi:hypothetical protein
MFNLECQQFSQKMSGFGPRGLNKDSFDARLFAGI